MNSIAYLNSASSSILKGLQIDCLLIDIDAFTKEFEVIYTGIKGAMDQNTVLIIDENCFFASSEIFEFVCYFRLRKSDFWDIPIYILMSSSSSYKSAIKFIQSDFSQVLKTARTQVITTEEFVIDSLTQEIALKHSINQIKAEVLIWQEFVSTISITPKVLSNHSIANKWAIYRWAQILQVNTPSVLQLKAYIDKDLYFTYLKALYPVEKSDVFPSSALKLKSKITPRILYVDDQGQEGWSDILAFIFKDINKFNFVCMDNELKDMDRDEVVNLVISKIKDIDIVVLDFRLIPRDQIEVDFKNITGLKILQAIKKYNRAIQVIIFSATNKVWNLQALQIAGADGFIVKESAENSKDENFTKEVIESFLQNMQVCLNRIFLKDIWNKFNFLNSIIPDYSTDFDISFKLLYDSFYQENFFKHAYLQLYLVIEKFINNGEILRGAYKENYTLFINDLQYEVFTVQKSSSNEVIYQSAITYKGKNEGYVIQTDFNFTRPIDTNAKMFALLIFAYGGVNKDVWQKINHVRNSKVAHAQGSTSVQSISIFDFKVIVDFIMFILDMTNIDSKNIISLKIADSQ